MNCKSDCRLCKSKGFDSNHIQFHCPKISNAVEKKKNQLPRRATGSTQRSVKSATSGSKKTDIKFTTYEDNGCYRVLCSKISTLTNKKSIAKLISRYETVQFTDLYHFVRFWHEAMGHADIKTMLLIATRIVSHPSEFRGFPWEFTPTIIRKYFPVTCHACPLGNLNRGPSFSGVLFWILAVCRATGLLWGKTLKTRTKICFDI